MPSAPKVNPRQHQILWIDDDPMFVEPLKIALETIGYRVQFAMSGSAGLELLKTSDIDLVIVDYVMPDMDGAAVAQEIKRLSPTLPVVMFSGGDTIAEPLPFIDALVLKANPPPALFDAISQLLSTRGAASREVVN